MLPARFGSLSCSRYSLRRPALAWNNGQSGNANTDTAAECSNPPYATHDWVAEQALMLLPQAERDWLMPFKAMYLIGTEAPDFKLIPTACQTPHRGYDDRSSGHSVEWASDGSHMVKDRAAQRAQEEYNKAAIAFRQGNRQAAAFYLGAMAHYIGDVSQYGHSIPNETHHSDYERFVATRTGSFNAGTFESFLVLDSLVRRSAYTAVKRISLATARGKGDILPAAQMDSLWSTKPQSYLDSIRPLAQPRCQRASRRAAYVLPERRVRGGLASRADDKRAGLPVEVGLLSLGVLACQFTLT